MREVDAISVMVYADSAIVRAGLESILRTSPELSVVGSSSSAATLDRAVEEYSPDVVLLEWNVPDEEPVAEKLLPLSAISPQEWAIVVLADSLTGAAEALRTGVRGVLPRSATAEEIIAAVAAAAAGLVVLHPEVVESLLPLLPSTARSLPTSPIQALTPREIEVLAMLAEGLGNKTIARRLGISEHTVKFHISSLFAKLNAKSRTEAVTLGARQGLIML